MLRIAQFTFEHRLLYSQNTTLIFCHTNTLMKLIKNLVVEVFKLISKGSGSVEFILYWYVHASWMLYGTVVHYPCGRTDMKSSHSAASFRGNRSDMQNSAFDKFTPWYTCISQFIFSPNLELVINTILLSTDDRLRWLKISHIPIA